MNMFGTHLGRNIKSSWIGWGAWLVLLASACQWNRPQGTSCEALVRVGDQVLCREDIPPSVYDGLHGQDSILAVKRYMDNWITDRVFLYYARQNVDTARINRLTENYRNSLLRDFYETELRGALSDTIRITPEELKAFYDRHKANFRAEDTLIRWRYLIMDDSFKGKYKIMRWFRSGKPEDIEKIEEQYKNLLAVKLDSGAWVPYREAASMMPFLKLRKPYGSKYPYRITKTEQSRVYLVDIFDAVYPGEILPYEYIEPQLRILLKQKKWKNNLRYLQEQMRNQAEKQKIIKYEQQS